MSKYILRLGENITLSIIENNQLVYHTKLSNLSELPRYVNEIEISEINVLAQGTPTSHIKDNSYRLSSFKKEGDITHFIMPERDLVYLTEICNSNKIEKLYVHSYLDYIRYRFRREDKVIVIDNYLDKYISIYLENGEIKDLFRSTADDLIDTIKSMNNKYQANAVSAKDNVDSLSLLSLLNNFNRIPKEVLHSIDHLSYLNETKIKSIINNSDIETLAEMWTSDEDDSDDNYITSLPDAIRKQKIVESKYKKNYSTISNKRPSRNIEIKDEDVKINATDIAVNIGIMLFIVLAAVGLYLNFLFSEKVELLKADIKLGELRADSNLKNNSSKALEEMNYVYSNLNSVKISSCSYEDGEMSVTVLTDNSKDKETTVAEISKIYPTSEYSFMGSLNVEGVDYEKTKFILSKP